MGPAGQLERLLAMLPDLLLEELLVSRPSEVLLEPGLELLQAVLLALLPPTLLPMASAASLVEERARATRRWSDCWRCCRCPCWCLSWGKCWEQLGERFEQPRPWSRRTVEQQ